MTAATPIPQVRHIPVNGRFELEAEGYTAVLLYQLEDDTINFTHTAVPAPLEGRGIGSQLARAGLEFARQNNYRVVSNCWFVTGYIERHKEYQPLLKE